MAWGTARVIQSAVQLVVTGLSPMTKHDIQLCISRVIIHHLRNSFSNRIDHGALTGTHLNESQIFLSAVCASVCLFPSLLSLKGVCLTFLAEICFHFAMVSLCYIASTETMALVRVVHCGETLHSSSAALQIGQKHTT